MKQYKAIFSDEIEKNKENFVVLIGKVLEIYNERKYIKINCIDSKGYFSIISYDPIDFDKFSTILVLGKVKEFNSQYFVYSKRIIVLKDLEDEILWKKFFIKEISKRRIKEYRRSEKSYEDTGKYQTSKNIEILEDKNIKIKKEILEFIKENDKGNGVSFEEIKNYFKISEDLLKKYIEDLLAIGEIYEFSPNKYKAI
ncbi:MAG: hypothetical protein QXX12_01270 [Nanopusillaceae archaeon]